MPLIGRSGNLGSQFFSFADTNWKCDFDYRAYFRMQECLL